MEVKKESPRFYTIDFLRILFCSGVVMGHTYCILFHIMCVDAFFMISGIMIARHFYIHQDEKKEKTFFNYQLRRYFRFLSSLIFIYAVSALIMGTNGNMPSFSFFAKKWPVLLLLSRSNSFANGLEIPSWYIDSLFWMGLVVSFCLCFYKQKSILFVFPLVIYFALSYIHGKYLCLNLDADPKIANFFSEGNFRALLGLCIGIEEFYLYKETERNNIVCFRGGGIFYMRAAVTPWNTVLFHQGRNNGNGISDLPLCVFTSFYLFAKKGNSFFLGKYRACCKVRFLPCKNNFDNLPVSLSCTRTGKKYSR